MRKIEIDNKRVIARNATYLGFATHRVKRGSYFVYRDSTGAHHMARSLGRIAWCDSDGENCVGHVVAMVWGDMGHCFERWIDPEQITECYDKPPHKIAAFFFAPELPHDHYMMRRLMEHGTLSEQHVENHAARVAMFEERLANAIVSV